MTRSDYLSRVQEAELDRLHASVKQLQDELHDLRRDTSRNHFGEQLDRLKSDGWLILWLTGVTVVVLNLVIAVATAE